MVPTAETIESISLPDNAAVENLSTSTTTPPATTTPPVAVAVQQQHPQHHNHQHSNQHHHANHHHHMGHHHHYQSPPPPHHMMMHPAMMVPHHYQPPHYQPHIGPNVITAPQQQPPQFTSLYVGDLSPEVNEQILAELFSKVGHAAVASIHVCRDSATFRSLGYAYVNFFNSIDAERALDTLNYSQVLGRPCRIMWSHRDPTKRKSNIGNIFVKNLEKTVDNALLFDTFSTFGNILSCKIEYEKGVSKGYGYVHFESQESSERAIEKVNGTLLLGKPITVEPFVSKVERFKEKNEHKLFIKNIDENATTEMLQQELSKFGEIESCIIRNDPNGKSKGLGFVDFKNVEDAQKLLDSTEPITILSKQITFDRIKHKLERNIEHRQQKASNNTTAPTNGDGSSNTNGANTTPNNNSIFSNTNLTIFINNIDLTVDKEVIREEFAKHGNILGIKIKPRGFAFLSYSTNEEAARAIEKMNGFTLGSKTLVVTFTNRKEKRVPSQNEQQQINTPYIYPTGVVPFGRAPTGYPPQVYQGGYYNQQQPPFRYNNNNSNTKSNNGTNPSQPSFNKFGNSRGASNGLNKQHPQSPPLTNGGFRKNRNLNNNTKKPVDGQQQSNGTTSPSQQQVATTVVVVEQTTPPQSPNPSTPTTTITLESLLSLTFDDAKEAVGSEIYQLVMNKYPNYAPKITGMILGSISTSDIKELYSLISGGSVQEKIEQAHSVLVQHQQQQTSNGSEDSAIAAN